MSSHAIRDKVGKGRFSMPENCENILSFMARRTIGDFIARDNPRRAISFIKELTDKCAGHADLPLSFPLVRATRKRASVGDTAPTRCYRVDRERVHVIRVLHSAAITRRSVATVNRSAAAASRESSIVEARHRLQRILAERRAAFIVAHHRRLDRFCERSLGGDSSRRRRAHPHSHSLCPLPNPWLWI